VEALRQVATWPAENAAVGVLDPAGEVGAIGEREREFLVAAEEGTLDLDEPAGPPGSTVRHLLAHASGLPFSGARPVSRPGERRIYSNTGFEVLAEKLAERAGMPFVEYLRAGVLEPLGMRAELRGSAAADLWGTLDDLVRFTAELLEPRLLAPETLAEATTVAFPGLVGVLPDFGRQDPNDWGLGLELRDGKQPHWTGTRNSRGTFGHFGGSGTFLWVDPKPGLACACLTDLEFGPWAKEAWPRLSDDVLAEAG
jgi:CubicO group peptidase (beta-lactamase class C family)